MTRLRHDKNMNAREKHKVHSKPCWFFPYFSVVDEERPRIIRRIHYISRKPSSVNVRWNYSPPKVDDRIIHSKASDIFSGILSFLFFFSRYVGACKHSFQLNRQVERTLARLQKAAALNLEWKAVLDSTSFKEEFSSYWRIFSRV